MILFLKKNKGFTLIEVIIAMAILATVMIAFFPLISHTLKGNVQNKHMMTANAIALGILEKIRSMNYDDIGTVGGNPAGVSSTDPNYNKKKILPSDTVNVDGVDYTVKVLITWGTGVDSGGKTDVTAYKNVRVIVTSPSIFSETIIKDEEVHSVIAREGEKPLVVAGNIQLTVQSLDGATLYSDNSTSIQGPVNQSLLTDYSGKALYGEITAGNYTTNATLPSGKATMTGTTIVGSVMSHSAVTVTNFQTTPDVFFVDDPAKYCHLKIKFLNASNNVITPSTNSKLAATKITLVWDNGGTPQKLLTKASFTQTNFDSNYLSADFIGNLSYNGSYNIILTYNNNDTVVSPKLDTGTYSTDWDRMFPDEGITIPIAIITTY